MCMCVCVLRSVSPFLYLIGEKGKITNVLFAVAVAPRLHIVKKTIDVL